MCTSTTACQANRWLSATITKCTGRADDVCFLMVVLNNFVSCQRVDPSWSIMPSLLQYSAIGLCWILFFRLRFLLFLEQTVVWELLLCGHTMSSALTWLRGLALQPMCLDPKSVPSCFRLCFRCSISWRSFQGGTDYWQYRLSIQDVALWSDEFHQFPSLNVF